MATTTNYGWTTPDDTALVKDGASAIRTLGSSVDTTTKNLNPETTLGDLSFRSSTSNVNTRIPIGSSGQHLTVVAGVPAWATASDQTPLTTKGDLLGFSTLDARIPIGANGTLLTADSSESLGLKWAAPAGGGKVLQVLQDTHTGMVTNNSTTLATTNLSQAITPASASNKVLITANVNAINKPAGNSSTAVKLVIDRDGSTIYTVSDFFLHEGTSKQLCASCTLVFLDSPATTSATTYTIKFAPTIASQEAAINAYNSSNTCVSSIVLMEIGA